MSRPRGGYIGFNRVPAASALNSAASGMWTLREAEAMRRAGTWPSAPAPAPGGVGTGLVQLWLDASDPTTLYDAASGGSLVAADGGVARWEDKSGNGRHFTSASASSQPTRKVADINGLDCLRFDGSDDVLNRSQEAWAHTVPLNFFVVFRAAAFTPEYYALWDFYGSTGGNVASNTGLIKSNGKSAIYLTATNNTQPNYDGTGSVTYAINTTHLFFASINNGAISSRGDKASDGSHTDSWANRTNLGGSPLSLGASLLFSRYTDIKICEFIVYNADLSTEDRDAVEIYLTEKWKP
jgi:hypothetical protein